MILTVASVFFMPYMTGMTEDVEKALFLRRFNVPFWGLAHVFERNSMYWYRMEQSFGRLNIVGTTVKQPQAIPQDLLADEKHTRRCGDKHYIAMTVGQGCILGAEMSDSASEAALTEAYGVFAKEARAINPDYSPDTVLSDSFNAAADQVWEAYQSTSKASFSQRLRR